MVRRTATKTRVRAVAACAAIAVVAGLTVGTGPTSYAADLELESSTSRPEPRRAPGLTVHPVPTSDAGLGEIVTAPNGDMWFVEEKANKVGRITPAGVITEFALPATTSGDAGGAYDLTVAPDGTIWVVFDYGRKIVQLDLATGTGTVYPLGPYPYGEQVEIGPDGVPWVSMSFDDDGLARVLPTGTVWHDNAPPCDGWLARANDGGMWCASSDTKLILSNADASGGTTYPLPSTGTTLRSLAAGPVGSMWFSRYSSSPYTSPARGDIGWIDQASGATTIFSTGSRTGPRDLLRGPDGAMWFTNQGVGDGIGHLHPDGTGAITKVGDYSPWSLTFDQAGALWFTDSVNNVIVRTNPAELQVTDVEVGDNSVFTVPTTPGNPTPGTPAATAAQVGKVVAGKKPLRVRRNKVRVPVVCPRSARTACRGVAVLRHRKRSVTLSRTRTYQVRPGKRVVVVLALTKAGKKVVKRKPVKVRVTLVTRDGSASRDAVVRVRR